MAGVKGVGEGSGERVNDPYQTPPVNTQVHLQALQVYLPGDKRD